MLYLKSFTFPTDGEEFDVIINVREKCYSSFYPFKILSQRGIERKNVTVRFIRLKFYRSGE